MEKEMNISNVCSKSSYICGDDCLKATYLRIFNRDLAKESDNQLILDNGIQVGELARELFTNYVTIPFSENKQQMVLATVKALESGYNVICEASFMEKGMFASVDIFVVKEDGNVDFYEVKSSTKVKPIFLKDVAFQNYLLECSGYTVNSANLIIVNDEYVRDDEFDINQYFKVLDVTEDISSLYDEVVSNVEIISNFMKSGIVPSTEIATHCFSPYTCPFQDYCMKDLPKNNIFKLKGGMHTSTKLKHFNNGIIDFEECLNIPKLNAKYKEQIECTLSGKDSDPHIEEIADFIKDVKYPIFFLDFETIMDPIPRYKGMHAYQYQIIQYSLHILEKPGSYLIHKEYLATPGIDSRLDVAKRLIDDIPSNGTGIAYNMIFEKSRIKELAEDPICEEYKDLLMEIEASITLDFMIPFKNRWIYKEAMHGSYSLKTVLPALFPGNPKLDYNNLEVQNGNMAAEVFLNLKNMTSKEQYFTRLNMLRYCRLDTYSLVAIFQYFINLTSKKHSQIFKEYRYNDVIDNPIYLGDIVTCDLGPAKVVDFTRDFVKVQILGTNYETLRMPHKITKITTFLN